MRNLKTSWISKWLVGAFLIIPLNEPSGWTPFKFMNAQPNQVTFDKTGMNIKVNNSASPILYPFKEAHLIKKIELKAKFIGSLPKMNDKVRQGNGNYDDFILRFGLIYQGNDRLNWIQRQLAPTWLVDMEKLLPKAMGIKEVHFYTTCLQEKLLNKTRRHMLHDKFVEECILHLKEPGDFQIIKEITSPKAVIGLWVASDADEMGNQFTLQIQEIKLTTEKGMKK